MVGESAKLLKERRCKSILLKLDIAKAFDNVAWQFLLELLKKVSFGPNWCDWIATILRTTSTRILLNGIPGTSFYHGRGLRHGDTLSPMLFTIVVDSLCKLFDKAKQSGILEPFSNRHSIPNVCPYTLMTLSYF